MKVIVVLVMTQDFLSSGSSDRNGVLSKPKECKNMN